MTNNITTFDKIIVGRKFKTKSGIVYKKLSVTSAVMIADKNGKLIDNQKKTSLFYNSKMSIFEIV
jgi:hypothetical protein